MRSIGVLIVDDSAVVREVIGDAIRAQPGLHVVGSAPDGRRGLQLVEQLRPDVVLLGMQMPGLDGLQTLDALLLARAVPVVMISALTQTGVESTLTALDHGAMDYIAKPESKILEGATFAEELVRKIRAVARIDVRRILEFRRERAAKQKHLASAIAARRPTPPLAVSTIYKDVCIAVGASIGGPPALTSLFARLRPPLPPIAVVQHMPPNFTAPLAKRLGALSGLEIKEADDGDEMRPNRVLLAPGGKHLQLRRRGNKVTAKVIEFEPVSGHRPSADVLLLSAAESYGAGTLGVIMTGMGRDGVAGCAAVKACGGFVVGQDEATSDVYGMNKAAFDEGYVDRQYSLDELSSAMQDFATHRLAGKIS